MRRAQVPERRAWAMGASDWIERPSQSIVHGSLLVVQLLFCGWVILAKASLPAGVLFPLTIVGCRCWQLTVSGADSVSPIVFCFYRECTSAVIMLAIAWRCDGVLVPAIQDIPRVGLCGACTFVGIFG